MRSAEAARPIGEGLFTWPCDKPGAAVFALPARLQDSFSAMDSGGREGLVSPGITT